MSCYKHRFKFGKLILNEINIFVVLHNILVTHIFVFVVCNKFCAITLPKESPLCMKV